MILSNVKKLIFLAMIFILQGCDNPMPGDCLYYTPISSNITNGQNIIVNTVVKAQISPDGTWYSTNISLKENEQYTVQNIAGMVSTCGSMGLTTNPVTYEVLPGNTLVAQGTQGEVIKIQAGDVLIAYVADPNSNTDATGNKIKKSSNNVGWNQALWDAALLYSCQLQKSGNDITDCKTSISSNPSQYNSICSLEGSYQDDKCWYVKGDQLYMYIVVQGSTLPAQGSQQQGGASLPNAINLLGGYGTMEDALHKFDPTNPQSNVVSSGTISFITQLTGDYTGGYRINVTQIGCPAFNGVQNSTTQKGGVLAYIGNNPANADTEGTIMLTQGKTFIANKDGTLYLKIDMPLQASNNGGDYQVKVATQTSRPPIAAAINKIVDYIQSTIAQAAQKLYENATCTGSSSGQGCVAYISLIRLLLILYIMFSGLLFILGMANISQQDLVIKALKFGTVVMLLQKQSWDFFTQHFLDIYIRGSQAIFAKATNAVVGATGGSGSWAFVDASMSLIINDPLFLYLLLSLVFASVLGIVYFIMLIYAVFLFIKAIFHGIKTYVFSILMVGFLTALTPIMLPLLLFGLSKEIFFRWIGALSRFALEPIVFLTGLIILSNISLNILKQILAYGVCWNCAFQIPPSMIPPFKNLVCINFFVPWGMSFSSNLGGLTLMLPLMTAFLILNKIMADFVGLSSEIIARIAQATGIQAGLSTITGGGGHRGGVMPIFGRGGGLSMGIGNFGIMDKFKSVIGRDNTSQGMRSDKRGEEAKELIRRSSNPRNNLDVENNNNPEGNPGNNDPENNPNNPGADRNAN
jgi:type IV secretory pathway VirB6-like protein